MDPSKPTEPRLDQQASIPRSRPEADEPLVGEVIPKGVPLARPTVDAQPQGPQPQGTPFQGSPFQGSPRGFRARKSGRLRTVMIVVAALAVGLCLGGLGLGYLLYDRATTPDRSTPGVTLLQYLEAKFYNRDDAQARTWECRQPKLTALEDLLTDVKAREAKFNVSLKVAPADLTTSFNNATATIDGHLKVSNQVGGVIQQDVEKWHFDFVREGGWRLCGASQPTP